MRHTIESFLKKNNFNNALSVIISLDLDNTLVVRKKGSNYVNKKILELIQNLTKSGKIIFVPNTGRELVGFSSFCKEVASFRNAVLGSGSLVVCDGKEYFNKRSKIGKIQLNAFYKAIKSGILPFVDLSHARGRTIFYNEKMSKYKDLLFSQNPSEWFHGNFPPAYPIHSSKLKAMPEVFRLEFPVIKSLVSHQSLFERLSVRQKNNLKELSEILRLKSGDILKDYVVRRKKFFSDKYSEDDAVFARFEKADTICNKGYGLRMWLDKSGTLKRKSIILHIGDSDKGIVDDTVIKDALPESHLIMVGKNAKPHNRKIDLCLKGDVEDQLLLFLEKLQYFNKIR